MKNKQKLSADNGVSLSYRVEANERIRVPFFNEIMLTLLSIIASVGAIMTFTTVLNFMVLPGVVISFIVGFSAIFAILYKVIKKHKYLVIVGAAITAATIALIFSGYFLKGVQIIFDQSRITISNFMGWDEPSVTYPWQDDFVSLTNFAIVLLSMVLCSAISYFTFVKQSFIAIFLLTFPFFEIGALFGAVPNYLYFSIMIASWAAYLTTSRVANSKIKMRRSNGKKQKKEIDGNRQKFAGIAVVIAMVVVFVFTGITTYLNAIDFTRAENIDNIRRETKFAFEDFIDYITGVDHDGSLKDGKLYAVDDRNIKNRHYITVQTNIGSIDEPMKIKGYTATIYKNNAWGQTENYDDYQAMFDEFAERSYMMGVNTGKLLSSRIDFANLNYADITLSGFRRKKSYAYEVYYSDLSSGFTVSYDSFATPKNESKYSYTSYLSSEYIYKAAGSEICKDPSYQQAKAQYTEFVNKEYVNSETTDKVLALAKSFNAADKYEYLNAVRLYLQENIKHTTKSGKCPLGSDFVEYFLFDSKKGYSTHFASAATVLMQAAGHPARYVEGYYIPTKAFNETETEHLLGHKTIDVTDKYAHAWIEIYDSTYGWIPIEVTPGYWSEPLSAPKPETNNDGDKEDESVTMPPEFIIPNITNPPTEEEPNIVDEEVPDKIYWANLDTKSFLEILASVLAVVALIVLAIYIIHLILMAKKKKILASDDVNKKIKFAYRYLFRLLSYQKVKVGNVYDYMALAEEIGEKVYYISADKLKYVFNIFLGHAYSQNPSTLQEADEVLKEIDAYSQAIYSDLSKYEKLIYKYLLNLC